MLNLIDLVGKAGRRVQSIIAGERGVLLIIILVFAIAGFWFYLNKSGFKITKKEIIKQINRVNVSIVLLILIGIGYGFRLALLPASPIYVILTYQRTFEREFPIPPEYWSINKISVGDISYNSLGKKIAEVVEIKKSYWGANRENIRLVVKVNAIRNKNTNEFTLDGKPLLIGNKIAIGFGKTQLNALITDIYQNKSERLGRVKRAKATLVLKGTFYEPWQAEALRDFLVKNSNGDIIAQAKGIYITPAEYSFTTDQGRVLILHDPIKKDLIMTLELYDVLCSDQTCYAEEDKPIKIGQPFWMTSDRVVLPGASIINFKIEYLDNQ